MISARQKCFIRTTSLPERSSQRWSAAEPRCEGQRNSKRRDYLSAVLSLLRSFQQAAGDPGLAPWAALLRRFAAGHIRGWETFNHVFTPPEFICLPSLLIHSFAHVLNRC